MILLALVLLVQDAKPTPTPWGRIEWKANAAHLCVDAWPADGKVAMPRLNNPIGAVYLQGDESKSALKFDPGVAEWFVTKPAKKEGNVVVVETVGAPHPAGDPVVAEAAADGSITLAAHNAVVHGKMLRYEPQPHKNTVGYWVEESDWCEWKFKVAKPGAYKVVLLQGCGKGQGGSAVKVTVAGQSLDYTVEDTGGFQAFQERAAGTVKIEKADAFTLEIRPVKKAKAAVMDVRQVKLVPVD
jgi:hypothetical protein